MIKAESFRTVKALVAFVNANSIEPESIISIIKDGGEVFLIYK